MRFSSGVAGAYVFRPALPGRAFFILSWATRLPKSYINSKGQVVAKTKVIDFPSMCKASSVFAGIVIDYYLITAKGFPTFTTIGLTVLAVLIYIFLGVLACALLSYRIDTKTEEELLSDTCLVLCIISLFAISIFTVLIMGHFNLI